MHKRYSKLYIFKNARFLGKMHVLPKIHKQLYNVPGRPIISQYQNMTP